MISPISIVILTKDEEIHIGRALDSVTWSDNVVVVDSGSTDRTAEICRARANVTFLEHKFLSLADQRQYALDSGAVRHPWVLALDADEIVPAGLKEELIETALRYQVGDPVAYDIAMRIYKWGKWLKHSSEYPVYWRRFFRRDCVHYVQRGHADTLDVNGPVGRTRNDLIHWDLKRLDKWVAKHNAYSTQEAKYALSDLLQVPLSAVLSRDRLMRRRALKRLSRSMPLSGTIRFFHLYLFSLGFLDGLPGFCMCVLKSFQYTIVRFKMQELRLRRDERV